MISLEIIAGKRIGEEMVTHVSNIYKYYAAYTLLAEQRTAEEKARSELRLNVPKQP